MSKTRLEPIRFTGGPTRLSAALRLPKGDLPARLVHVELTGTAGRMKVRPVSGTDPSISILKLRLPRNTPPGSYRAQRRLATVCYR